MSKTNLSTKTLDIICKNNRVTIASLADGQTILTMLQNGTLYQGEVARCDGAGCVRIGLVNGGLVNAAVTSERALIEANLPFAYSSKGNIEQEIGCYDDDGSGDVLCSVCASWRAKAEGKRS